MAKKKNDQVISASEFEKTVKQISDDVTIIEWEGLNIQVKKVLSLKEVAQFVNTCAKACFGDDGNYMPEAKDFAVKSCVLSFYSNISLPSNLDKQYDLIYKSKLAERIIAEVDPIQFRAMISALTEKITYEIKDGEFSVSKQRANLYRSINSLIDSIANFDINNDNIDNLIQVFSNNSESDIVKAILSSKQDV